MNGKLLKIKAENPSEPARAGVGIALVITRLSKDDIGQFSQRNATFYEVISIADKVFINPLDFKIVLPNLG